MGLQVAIVVLQIWIDSTVFLRVEIRWKLVYNDSLLCASLPQVWAPLSLPYSEIMFEWIDLSLGEIWVELQIRLRVKIQRQPSQLKPPKSHQGLKQAFEERFFGMGLHEWGEADTAKRRGGQTFAVIEAGGFVVSLQDWNLPGWWESR